MTVKELIDILETMPKDSFIKNGAMGKLVGVWYPDYEGCPDDPGVWMTFELDLV